jgi:N-acetylglucosamine-6-phosphate deacetylase
MKKSGDNSESLSESLWLRGARIVLPGSVAEGAAVLVERGRIARITRGEGVDAPPPRGARTLDLAGLTLYPGFVDLHIHGAVGVDATGAVCEDLRRVARFLAARGVTAWLPTLVPAPESDYSRAVSAIDELMASQRASESDAAARSSGGAARPSATRARRRPASAAGDGGPGAHALGVHYEGPFVNESQCGALRTQYFRIYKGPQSLTALRALAAPGAAHMITVAPEIEGGIKLVRELASRGWLVSVGHTRADIPTLDAARAAGARHMTHFFNAMSPLHHRAPGPVGWGLTRDDVTCDIVADGVHCDPVMLRLALRCKTAERLALVSDAVAPTGLGDGEHAVWGETITVERGRTRNGRGHIAGSVITMLDAARRMLSLGATPPEVARMAALLPARLAGCEHERGSVEEGKRADLVALDEAGRPRLTLVGGRTAFDELSDDERD